MTTLRLTLPAPTRWPGTMAWLLALACFAMLLASGAALALGRTAAALRGTDDRRLAVEIVDARDGPRHALASHIVRLLQRSPGVAAVRIVDDREAAALVSPYIGDAMLAELPLPILIDADLRDGSARAALVSRLRAVRGVQVDDGPALSPLVRFVAVMRRLALAVAALGVGGAALTTVLAARAMLAIHEGTITILQSLGASDGQIARLTARYTAREAGIGAVVGLVGALLALRAIGNALAELGSDVARAAFPDMSGAALLLALPLALVALAVLTAHLATLALLDRTA